MKATSVVYNKAVKHPIMVVDSSGTSIIQREQEGGMNVDDNNLDDDSNDHEDNDNNENDENDDNVDEEDEDSEDEDDEYSDDDDISEPSYGLRADLEAPLDFSFRRGFYHVNVLTTAPNPFLSIDGIGLVVLPLSERDAKAIVSCATLASHGHGERTVIDKEVRDPWEIEPARIIFGNTEWVNYIDGVVCHDVCKALGVSIQTSPPKMELYKLLLYETGSQFSPHQDTQKANGMFATVVILLPSEYTGGQVVVSHASMTKVFDMAPNSLLSTAILAWYTNVRHEVKPVTSGYRLALSYNLIHVAPPDVPMPTLPEMGDAVARIRRVLREWKEGQCEQPEVPLLAYLLDHEYSDLKQGLQALKGADGHRVRALRDIAEEEGYFVGLASLDHNISGSADDDWGSHDCRGRYNYYDEDLEEDMPEMEEVSGINTYLSGLVDLNGLSLMKFGEIVLEEENLVQADPFKGEKPDEKQYMGDDAGGLLYCYHRTVLVLMHQDNVDSVCFSIKDVPYVFEKLTALGAQTTKAPTPDMRLWANRLISNARYLSKDHTIKLLDLALRWRDVNMFNTIIKSSVSLTGTLNLDALLKAWKVFSFENIRSSLEVLLSQSKFSTKMDVIYKVKSKASREATSIVHVWCDNEAHKVLSSYAQADVNDISTIISLGHRAGWPAFFTILLPKLFTLPHSYQFWIAFIRAVRKARQSILESVQKSCLPTTSSDTDTQRGAVLFGSTSTMNAYMSALGAAAEDKNIVDALMDKALEIAAKQWSHAPASYSRSIDWYGSKNTNIPQMAKVGRIIEIIDSAIMNDNVEICRMLFIDIVNSPGTSASKFIQLYTPLIPRLCALLSSKKKEISSAPFVDLFQILIGTYLRDVLGEKGHLSTSHLRKIGCGCTDCQVLDKFILNPQTSSETFPVVQSRGMHLESQIAKAPDLCTYTTIRSGIPQGVQVTKRPEIVQASMWEHRQREAKKFLKSIGPAATIKKIMGGRYADVVAAVNGEVLFGDVTGSTGNSLSVMQNSTPAATSSTTTTRTGGAAPISRKTGVATVTHPIAGQKRKRSVVDLGVVDLTED